MRTTKLIWGLLFFSSLMSAQVAITVNVGTAPAWGPAVHAETRYYYLPEIETYYDLTTSQYIYISNGHWVRERILPIRHRHYNLYSGPKIILADHGPRPYAHFHSHKVKYRPQVHHRPHYYADKHFDRHHHKQHKHGRGHGHGHD